MLNFIQWSDQRPSLPTLHCSAVLWTSVYIWVTISSVHLLSHFVTFYHISSHCVLSYIQLQWKVLLLVLLLVMDSICGGGEHWAKPKEIQRKETVIDFHLYVGHREPIKYEILYVGSYSWKCTKYRVVSVTGQIQPKRNLVYFSSTTFRVLHSTISHVPTVRHTIVQTT